jgi:exosortase
MLIAAETTRVGGLFSMRPSVERYALVLAIAGSVLLVAGWRLFGRVLWIWLFLFLMVPLPNRAHDLISGPMQTIATAGSVFLLEALGVMVSQQGNTMILNGNTHLGVAEACSGLRMLTAFIIVAAFVAYMVKRSQWQKALLLLSSIPVALICNILRIVVTAVLMLHVGMEVAQKFFHDFAGLVMMPAAVMLMFGELSLMNRLTVSEPKPQQVCARARAKPTVKAGTKQMSGKGNPYEIMEITGAKACKMERASS